MFPPLSPLIEWQTCDGCRGFPMEGLKSLPSHLPTELRTRRVLRVRSRAPTERRSGFESSDPNSSFEIVNCVSQPQTQYCNARGGKMLEQNLRTFPSGAEDPAAYYFPCFSWRSLYWDFAIWLPRRAKMVRPGPILDRWCMQSFRVKTPPPLLPRLWRSSIYLSWGVLHETERDVCSTGKTQCEAKRNMSGVLAFFVD